MLRELVLYIASRFPRGVGRTRLMKLLFLVDALASRELGRSLTGVEWRRWRYGPFSREVLDALDDLVEVGRLAVDAGPEVRYRALEEPPELPEDVRRIVDRVVKEYGFLPLRELLRRVYEEHGIERLGMGERIELDWRGEILELARKSGTDECALVELVGRIYEEYRDALELLPGDVLALYTIAAPYLSIHDLGRLEELTRCLLDLLEELKRFVGSGKASEPLPPELLRKVKELYDKLLDAVAEALAG